MESIFEFDNHVLLDVNNTSLFTTDNVNLLFILLFLLLIVVIVEVIHNLGLEELSFTQGFI